MGLGPVPASGQTSIEFERCRTECPPSGHHFPRPPDEMSANEVAPSPSGSGLVRRDSYSKALTWRFALVPRQDKRTNISSAGNRFAGRSVAALRRCPSQVATETQLVRSRLASTWSDPRLREL